MLNKIRGALFGLAIGDAMGATTEFMESDEIANTFGKVNKLIGGGWLNLAPGEETDDTQMTIAVAKGIIDNPNNPIPEIGRHFLTWRNSDPKDIGSIVSTSLMFYDVTNSWTESSKKAHTLLGGKSAGNGSLMRCLPIALAYSDSIKIIAFTKQQSQMTHYDVLATEACLINNSIASKILSGVDLKTSIKETIRDNETYAEVLDKYPERSPDGFVVGTLKWVLRALYISNSYQEVVETLVNVGGDSDTTSAIAGGLAGLYWGYDAIPQEHIDKLLVKDELERIAQELFSLRKNK